MGNVQCYCFMVLIIVYPMTNERAHFPVFTGPPDIFLCEASALPCARFALGVVPSLLITDLDLMA